MTGIVVKALREDGIPRDKNLGKKVSELPKNLNLALDIMLSGGQLIRVIQKTKTTSRKHNYPVTILHTAVPLELVSLDTGSDGAGRALCQVAQEWQCAAEY